LEEQLKSEGIEVNLQTDNTTQWFNTLWADNGDAISKQYTSTRALKGDYTRTRKRDYRGTINDFGLSVSRYFNNIVNDFFSQAVIDYLLGNVTSQVFSEFEATMMSGDPAMSMRRVRQSAIDSCSRIVISENSEELIGGWTLQCPLEFNTVRTYPFEEAVLLLTDAALYAVRFDWNIEKISSFERVDLRSVTGIMRGTYVTSTLTASQMDERTNVGFVVKYRPGKADITRVNTRSLSSTVSDEKTEPGDGNADASEGKAEAGEAKTGSSDEGPKTKTKNEDKNEKDPVDALKILAFKALPARSSFANVDGQEPHIVSEDELVKSICEEIQKAALAEQGDHTDFIEEKEIISLADAKKSTGLFEQWGHQLKKLVWA